MKKPSRKKPGKKAPVSYDQRTPASRKKASGPKKPALKKKVSTQKKTPKTPTQAPRSGWVKGLVNWGGTLVLWGILIVGTIFGYFAYTLPDISNIAVIEKRPSLVLKTADNVRFA
ncbi:MAG: hypothetical protein JKY04_01100, partial [Sneathiella sp.]|nr:hypothetical protein [Sneathiella sp.]